MATVTQPQPLGANLANFLLLGFWHGSTTTWCSTFGSIIDGILLPPTRCVAVGQPYWERAAGIAEPSPLDMISAATRTATAVANLQTLRHFLWAGWRQHSVLRSSQSVVRIVMNPPPHPHPRSPALCLRYYLL